MDMNNRFLTFLTIIVAGMIAVEWMGLFNGINAYVYAHTPSITTPWVSILTKSAGFGAFGLYVLLFLAWDLRERRLNFLTLNFILSLFIGMFFVMVLKALTAVPRPNEAYLNLSLAQALLNADYFAFPSGHATRASILACFLGERFPKYKPLWWLYAILIAFLRLLLHVHWFSDVLFALVLGLWISVIVESTAKLWLPIYNSIMQKLRLGVFRVE
ncbi:phosphatase PAP2 family protein [Palaeococcus sp. (in: euryarchaeotes)]